MVGRKDNKQNGTGMYSPMQLPFPFSHRTSLSYSASLKLWGLVDRCGRTRGAPRKRIAHQNLSCRVAQAVGVDWQEVPQGPPAHPTKEQGWALCYGLNRPRGGGKNSVTRHIETTGWDLMPKAQ